MSANKTAQSRAVGPDQMDAGSAQASVGAQRRRVIRYVAAVLAALTAAMYFLIGFSVVSVLDGNADQSWGLLPGAAYAFGVLLLLAFDRRIFWTAGAALQVLVIFTYFNLASQRTPAFEVWGILIRVAQVAILIALAYLAFRLPSAQASASRSNR